MLPHSAARRLLYSIAIRHVVCSPPVLRVEGSDELLHLDRAAAVLVYAAEEPDDVPGVHAQPHVADHREELVRVQVA